MSAPKKKEIISIRECRELLKDSCENTEYWKKRTLASEKQNVNLNGQLSKTNELLTARDKKIRGLEADLVEARANYSLAHTLLGECIGGGADRKLDAIGRMLEFLMKSCPALVAGRSIYSAYMDSKPERVSDSQSKITTTESTHSTRFWKFDAADGSLYMIGKDGNLYYYYCGIESSIWMRSVDNSVPSNFIELSRAQATADYPGAFKVPLP